MNADQLKSFKDLVAWQIAFDLVLDIYRMTQSFPEDERFGIVAQLLRAAVSIPSNVAEGYGRRTRQDYLRFLWMAKGSLAELETQIRISMALEFGEPVALANALAKADRAQRVLHGLIQSLSRGPALSRSQTPNPEPQTLDA